MSSRPSTTMRRQARRQCGFTLIELMVTVGIALFLLGGLLTILQNVRATYGNQQALAQLQDQQRFAMTVLTDVIQAGGYFPDPGTTITSALPAAGAYQAGQAFTGTQGAGGPDSIGVRYRTAGGDGVILCDGSTNLGPVGTSLAYTNLFTVVPPAAGVPGKLLCTLNDNPTPLAIVSGVQGLSVYYGVKRNPGVTDYNVDTYLTADQMLLAGPNGNDWANISSVRVILTFTNPLAGQPGQQPTILFERVIEVMSRAGVHT